MCEWKTREREWKERENETEDTEGRINSIVKFLENLDKKKCRSQAEDAAALRVTASIVMGGKEKGMIAEMFVKWCQEVEGALFSLHCRELWTFWRRGKCLKRMEKFWNVHWGKWEKEGSKNIGKAFKKALKDRLTLEELVFI